MNRIRRILAVGLTTAAIVTGGAVMAVTTGTANAGEAKAGTTKASTAKELKASGTQIIEIRVRKNGSVLWAHTGGATGIVVSEPGEVDGSKGKWAREVMADGIERFRNIAEGKCLGHTTGKWWDHAPNVVSLRDCDDPAVAQWHVGPNSGFEGTQILDPKSGYSLYDSGKSDGFSHWLVTAEKYNGDAGQVRLGLRRCN